MFHENIRFHAFMIIFDTGNNAFENHLIKNAFLNDGSINIRKLA